MLTPHPTDLKERLHPMADSNSPKGGALPKANHEAATPPAGGPPAFDPVAVIRSKRYIGALVLAAILGIPISAVAYGFLALVAAMQRFLFTDLPNQMLERPAPPWWPLPWLTLCGLLVGLTIRYLPGERRSLTRIWLSDRGYGHCTGTPRHRAGRLGHTWPRRRARTGSAADRDWWRAWGVGGTPCE